MKIFSLILVILLVLPFVFCARLSTNDFEYVGAFRFPINDGDISRWAYGGYGLTYDPVGDANSPNDGYPGSLFGIGHEQHQLVSEISIPAPFISQNKNASELPIATTLQPFAEITQGLMRQAGNDHIGDLAYKDGLLYWTIFDYYVADARNYLSHGVSSSNLAQPNARGVWRLGSDLDIAFHSVKTSDYITTVPQSWSDMYAPGMSLASGRQRAAGAFGGSKGPPLYVFRPEILPYGASLDAVALMWYNETYPYPSFSACDSWQGLAWVTAQNASAVVITGRKGLGPEYYGVARPQDCTIYKGYHCGPYESQILLYDTDELGRVAQGREKPYDVAPYAIIRPTSYFWGSCGGELGGAAYDDQNRLLYVIETDVDFTRSMEPKPIVHVFRINHNAPNAPIVNNSNSTPVAPVKPKVLNITSILQLPKINNSINSTPNAPNQTSVVNATANQTNQSNEANYNDADGDGFFRDRAPIDCNDNNTRVNPNATEIQNNQIDDDCNSNTIDSPAAQTNVQSTSQSTSSDRGVGGFAITYRNATNTTTPNSTNSTTLNVTNTTIAQLNSSTKQDTPPKQAQKDSQNSLMNLILAAIALTIIAIIAMAVILWKIIKK